MADEWGFAPPPFKPDEALQRMKREWRELGLSEREGRYERRGVALVRATVDGAQIAAAIVRRPSRSSPEWQTRSLKSAADARDFTAELKKKLTEWSDRDD